MALITTATINTDLNDSASESVTGVAVGSTAFIYDTLADTGQDTLALGKNDSLLTTRKIFDSNDDEHIQFNDRNDTMQSDRVEGGGFAGDDTIKFTSVDGRAGLRYLGERDGYFVYADKTVFNDVKLLGFKPREGTVNDDTIKGSGEADAFLYDTALGLNLGNDTITNFGKNDRVLTTSKIFDSNGNGKIKFGGNEALDLPGDLGGEGADGDEFGGILSITGTNGAEITTLVFYGETEVNGVTYFHYGLHPDA